MKDWHVSRDGKVRGPFTEPEVFELIGRGKVGAGDMLSIDAGKRWFPIEQSPTFSPSLTVAQASAPQVAQYVPPQPAYYHPQPIVYSVPSPSACPWCGAIGSKITKSHVTNAGWAVFFVFLLLCFPISLVALVAMRESQTICERCNSVV